MSCAASRRTCWMRSNQVRNAAIPFSARLAAYSCKARTAGAEIGATAAWSRNAHRAVTGNSARNADQSVMVSGRRQPAGGLLANPERERGGEQTTPSLALGV